jgi:hypothetical protein
MSGSKQRKILVALAGAAILLGVSLFWTRSTPEREVRETLDQMAQAVQALDADKLAEFISDAYAGEIAHSKDELLAEARDAFDELKSVAVKIDLAEPRVDGDQARVIVVFYISGEFHPKTNPLYPRFAGINSVGGFKPEGIYAEFRREDGRWRASLVDWKTEPRLDDFPKAKSALKG